MRLQQRRDNFEPQPRTACFSPGGEERLENAGAVAFGNALAVVPEGDLHGVGASAHIHFNQACSMLKGVCDQVGRDDLEVLRRNPGSQFAQGRG